MSCLETSVLLSGLLPLVDEWPGFARLTQRLATAGQASLRLVEGAKPALIAALARRQSGPVVVVTATAQHAQKLSEHLQAWLPETIPGWLFAEPDALFYEQLPWDPVTVAQRLRVLAGLSGRSPTPPPVVVASARTLLQRLMTPAEFQAATLTLRPGQRLALSTLLAHLVQTGYQPVPLVEEPGQFSHRGGIVDLFPPTADRPCRLEFFGDEIDTLREFDPATQRSVGQIGQVVIPPAHEILPGPLADPPALDRLRPEVARQWQRDLAWLQAGQGFPGLEFYAPYRGQGALLDYLPPGTLLVLDEPPQILAALEETVRQAEALRAQLTEKGYLPAAYPTAYWPVEPVLAALSAHRPQVRLSWQGEAAPGEAAPDDIAIVPPYGGRLRAVLDDCRAHQQARARVVLVSQQDQRLAELLTGHDLVPTSLTAIVAPPPPGSLALVHGSLAAGFRLRLASGDLVLLTDAEIFGWVKPRRVVRARTAPRETFLSDLSPGDYVVHVEHGVGRYRGLVRLSQDGVEREYLELEYAAGDRLYVPVDQADRVSRYLGLGDQPPTLHRLGTGDWARTRARVRAAVRELARDLLALYAARAVTPGFAFSPDTPWQKELEAAFPYTETPDQIEAIQAVKADMERPRPMDRLLCGDVGYGKTEVALRAAFKAVMDGKQVAVLVPTTVLAQQHYQTFRERLQAFPVRVEMLSRFRSEREQKEIIAGLKTGAVDIVIGTHRLLQKDVAFKDLGLVIIDEEQRFGVAHKEHLKQLRREVDVLTLTATPIPRTLYMALVNLRDLSTMETPPEDRLPIRTYVLPYDEGVIREAILRELERGGQVFFVHNRVQTIYQTAARLQQLVPEASIVVGHGQMPEEALEQVMLDFAAGRYDVLVCTTIIESGLDIPNANTIIVDRADTFGLAQLYQLRGRVGRGAQRAYAYFLYPPGRVLSEVAEKRLRTIAEATELGAGFRIAMKDLEIRGAGNLLGPEQHGHVAAVGFHLYCQLLAEAVRELQGQAPPPQPPALTIDVPLPAYLPADYIPGEAARLAIYQRLAKAISPEEVGALLLEMRDRFGPPPEPVLNLVFLVQVKLLAAAGGVAAITSDESRTLLRLHREEPARLAQIARRYGPGVQAGRSVLWLDRDRLGPAWVTVLEEICALLAGVCQQKEVG